MSLRAAILDERASLRKPFYGSVALHLSLVVSFVAVNWYQAHRPRVAWGDIHGGGIGSVAVTVVQRIPLPTENGPVNPVASDTQSRVPEPPPQPKAAKAPPKAPLKDLDSIPISTRDAINKTRQAASAPNKFRESQKDQPNQLYSQSGQRLVAPNMVGMTGGGSDVSFGNNSPFGNQFGEYAASVKNRVAQRWRTGEFNKNIRPPNPVVVTFTIQRNGAVTERSVRVRQTSGVQDVDLSAERAILEAAPFQPLPARFSGSSVDVEFWFTLRR